jgi:Tripartite tricarboxylate transporter TctB family
MSEPDKPLLANEVPLPPRRDLAVAAIFFLLGLSILELSTQMPNYFDQKGTIYTAPGLVPGFYGIVIAGLSIWLGLRSMARARQNLTEAPVLEPSRPSAESSNLRLTIAMLLCVAFAVGLIGRMPFWLAAALFVTLFIAVFEWSLDAPLRERLTKLAVAAIIGLATGLLVTLVFEKVFFVRLP